MRAQAIRLMVLVAAIHGCTHHRSHISLHTDSLFGAPQDLHLRAEMVTALHEAGKLSTADERRATVNILKHGRYYRVEVWPAGAADIPAIGYKVHRRTMAVVEEYEIGCQRIIVPISP